MSRLGAPALRAGVLREIVRAHLEGDQAAFRKAALQLAAIEGDAGHIRIAEELRSLLAASRAGAPVIDIAQPRGTLAEILDGGYRAEREADIVLSTENRRMLHRILRENRSRHLLERFSVGPRRRLLFHGPPGCGKTLAAAVIAGELGVPLLTIRLDALFSRFLGATANHLRAVFQEMPRRPGVYLFDEFDAIAKARGDSQDVGEMRRIVTSFLQFMDADASASVLIAATNHLELLDRAIFRRFDLLIHFGSPTLFQIADLIGARLKLFSLSDRTVQRLAARCVGRSFADVGRACDDAVRTMAIEGRSSLSASDLSVAFRPLAPLPGRARGLRR
jgi:AAA+ superfamily predicted ATPase